MSDDLFTGRLVRLCPPNPDTDAEMIARWKDDSEYSRLESTDPALPWLARSVKAEMERAIQEDRRYEFAFVIRTLADDRAIGFIDLDGIEWPHGDGWVGIGIGEREYWGKGYGTDAMEVLLRFAFVELNLHRVSLNVFEYNPRAIRSYEKVGFVAEGWIRQALLREGRRWDKLCMGILREEWEKRQRACD